MGKQKPAEAPKTAEKTEAPETNAYYIKEAMQSLGENGSAPADVFQWITHKYPQYKFSESSIKQGCTKVREELGFKPLRNRAGGNEGGKRKANDDGTVTLNDVDEARALLKELSMKPAELLKLVARIDEIGSTSKLVTCLTWLDGWEKNK